jgi:hypothetical protein
MIYTQEKSIIELKKLLNKINYHCQIFDLNEKEIYQALIMEICKHGQNKGHY